MPTEDSMKRPVNELTVQEALLEMEQLADTRPAKEEVLARINWDKANAQRLAELEVWIMTQPKDVKDPEPDPAPVAAPEPEEVVAPKPTPRELLDAKVAKYCEVVNNLSKDPGNKRLRDHLNVIRYDIRGLAKKVGRPMPELPETPASPFGHKPRKPMAAPAHRPVGVPTEPIAHAPARPEVLDVAHIASVRRSVWLLMAALEELPMDERAHMVGDLALLDAAAHAAHSLALGELNVA